MISFEDYEGNKNTVELKGFQHTLILSSYWPERDTQMAMVDYNHGENSALLDIEDVEAIHRWSEKVIAAHKAANDGL